VVVVFLFEIECYIYLFRPFPREKYELISGYFGKLQTGHDIWLINL